MPRSVRRVGLIRAPVNAEDPTEAVAAQEIVPAIHRCLKVLAQRDYGGNLLSLVYPNLRRPHEASHPGEREAFQGAVQRLLGWESSILGGERSFFTLIVAEKPESAVLPG